MKAVKLGEKTTKKAKRHEQAIKKLKDTVAKTAAENNILSAKVKAYERNAKRRKTVLGGGKKRKTNWDVQTGQGYDQQQDRLKTTVTNLFHDDVPHEYVMGLMADAVVHSKEGRAALEKTPYMKKREKVIEQEAMDRIQEHLDEVGLSAKHCLMMSWGQWEKLRRILGFKFNPPKNESYCDKDDQGAYVRCALPSGTKLFVLPSKYLMQKKEDVIVQEAGGYTKLDDGCGFEVDWKRKIQEELELKPAAYWEQRGGAEIQVLGDAFRIFAGAKCVNVGARAIGATLLRGHKTAFKTMMVWEGGDDYQSVLQKMIHCCITLKEMSDLGYVETKNGRIPFKLVGGGDMLWINDLLGLGGFAGIYKCSWCTCTDKQLGLLVPCETRTLSGGFTRAHVAPPGTDYPFDCPNCKETISRRAAPFTKKADGLKHRNSHDGQNRGCPPLLPIAPMWMTMCALHSLLAVAGTIFSNGIAKHLVKQEQCDMIDEYLHKHCNTAYKCKRVSLSEAQAAMKRPSFDGRSANEVIGRMEDLLYLKNLGGELSREDKNVLDAANKFIQLCNTAMERMAVAEDKNGRAQKVQKVQAEAIEFHTSFVLAFSQTSVTPYVHCLVMHLAQQIMVIKGDWTDYSGQALEHKNKERKSQARITSKRRMPAGDLAKYKKNGELMKDMYDELAVQDIVGDHVIGHRQSRPSLYQRNLMKVGYKSLNLDIKRELDNSAFLELAAK